MATVFGAFAMWIAIYMASEGKVDDGVFVGMVGTAILLFA